MAVKNAEKHVNSVICIQVSFPFAVKRYIFWYLTNIFQVPYGKVIEIHPLAIRLLGWFDALGVGWCFMTQNESYELLSEVIVLIYAPTS